MARHSSRDSIENILPRFEPVERVANDPVLDGSEWSFLTSNSAKIAWVSWAACLYLTICMMGKISVTSSIIIRPGMNLAGRVSAVRGSQSYPATYHIGGAQYLLNDAKLSV